MSISIFKRTILLGLAGFSLLQVACKKDSTPAPEPVVVGDQSFSQSFESKAAAQQQGWIFTNLSDDANATKGWAVRPDTDNGLTAYDGTNLLFNNYEASTGFDGIISDWAISPKIYFQNGDTIRFYTASHGSLGYGASGKYGDRLQLRLNTFNTSAEIGSASTDVGGFTTPLIDINPLYKTTSPGDYPTTWTKYQAVISGLNQPDSGRFAIRYFVELHGGANGDEIAVDKVEFRSLKKQ